ncbi:MAG: DUF47 family protein [Candidatus Hadarchaeales archaeon]
MRVIAASFTPIIGKGEKTALEKLKNNSQRVFDTVKKAGELLKTYFLEKNMEKAETIGKEVSRMETEADRGRREFMEVLHSGAFLPALRGDLARLAESLDRVADVAEGMMRDLLLRRRLMDAVLEAERRNQKVRELWDNISKMVELTEKTVSVMCESINLLDKNMNTAIEKAKEVDRLEHEVDIIEHDILRNIYALENTFDPVSIYQLASVINRYENVTDRAEDVGDLVAILVYSFRA